MTNDLPSVGTEDALSVDVLTDLCALHDRTGGGVWVQGMSSHETVLKREGKPDYHVAHFRHADYASFVDAAHKYMPLLIGEITDLRSERDALAGRVAELEAKPAQGAVDATFLRRLTNARNLVDRGLWVEGARVLDELIAAISAKKGGAA